jgi:hypothetical protein
LEESIQPTSFLILNWNHTKYTHPSNHTWHQPVSVIVVASISPAASVKSGGDYFSILSLTPVHLSWLVSFWVFSSISQSLYVFLFCFVFGPSVSLTLVAQP